MNQLPWRLERHLDKKPRPKEHMCCKALRDHEAPESCGLCSTFWLTHVISLGPTICPHRSPLGGRNFESFSEDPLLAGNLATRYIQGLQSTGVGATVKHYAANEQETHRVSINANISERALREIYLKPFEIAIKNAVPWAVMTSYNLVNGTHSDYNEFLLQTVLRDQWKFKGLVMSDWGGTNSVAESIAAG